MFTITQFSSILTFDWIAGVIVILKLLDWSRARDVYFSPGYQLSLRATLPHELTPALFHQWHPLTLALSLFHVLFHHSHRTWGSENVMIDLKIFDLWYYPLACLERNVRIIGCFQSCSHLERAFVFSFRFLYLIQDAVVASHQFYFYLVREIIEEQFFLRFNCGAAYFPIANRLIFAFLSVRHAVVASPHFHLCLSCETEWSDAKDNRRWAIYF